MLLCFRLPEDPCLLPGDDDDDDHGDDDDGGDRDVNRGGFGSHLKPGLVSV